MFKQFQRTILLFGCIILLGTIGIVFYFYWKSHHIYIAHSSVIRISQQAAPVLGGNNDLLASKTPMRPTKIISSGDIQFARDLNDNRNLMGDSHYVFVGRVINQAKSEGWNTEFDVQVIKNIKGNLQGTVLVHVTGGYRGGTFYVMDGSTWLEPGSTYLLATRYDGTSLYHLISFPAAWKLLNQDPNLADTQLAAVAENDPRVKQLELAYTNEVPLPVDIAHNNALNSYQSLTEAQKYALPYYTGSYGITTSTTTSTSQ